MTMLKTFDLKGNKQSFANWISNLSPCETPFISMVPKQKIDQTQYSWQSDRLVQPNKVAADIAGAGADANMTAIKEGDAFVSEQLLQTKVYTNFTQIFRKAVRITDTSKRLGLWGRGSEMGYQLDKAGKELMRDVESAVLTNVQPGRHGTAAAHGLFDGIQTLIAPVGAADTDTGAVVRKVVTYSAGAGLSVPKFAKKDVWDITYNLFLVGAKANKIMFHPMHVFEFSDWIGNTAAKTPHVHRMFDGLDDKYNAFVKTVRDPLGQVFTLIPNRHMPVNQLFFFNENDWTQMVLREPQKELLAKMGSSETHMIEMEVGLRHRHPFASGILEFNVAAFPFIHNVTASPSNAVADSVVGNQGESVIRVQTKTAAGTINNSSATVSIAATAENDDGTVASAITVALDDAGKPNATTGIATGRVKHNKAARIKVVATATNGSDKSLMHTGETTVGAYEKRD